MTAISARLDRPLADNLRDALAFARRHAVLIALGLIVGLAAFLRFYQLGAYSIGNAYYAATVKSMLTSWHNFFFASFEPGGSVTVDKPPVGFWLQAASAYVFGVNGFALALPQAIAGTLSVPLLFVMVRRHFGAFAGLVAALALALVPIAVATDRNNTIDSVQLFVVLLAVWAAVRSLDTGRLRWLLITGLLIGIAFNIKMWPAFAPVPAIYAVYALGARHAWWKRGLHLAAASVVILVVSLSWAVAVDLTPADARPYVGSSEDNSVMELITGHNGLSRFTNDRGGGGGPAANAPAGVQDGQAGPLDGNNRPLGDAPVRPQGDGPPDGTSGAPPAGDDALGGALQGQDGGNGPDGGSTTPFSQETGEPGLLRLFSEPLVDEASWLLPLALLAVPIILLALGRLWPLTDKHLALILWFGWLLPEIVYFSFTTGIFHAYYVIMLGPPVAALVGAAVWAVLRLRERRFWLGSAALLAAAAITLVFQIGVVTGYSAYAPGIIAAAVLLALAGVVALFGFRTSPARLLGPALIVASLLVAPAVWSTATAIDDSPDVGLPHSVPESVDSNRPGRTTDLTADQQAVLDYLLASNDTEYLVATVSANEAAPYILETGLPVFTFGGFSGSDPIIDADGLAQMVAGGELRYILGSQNLQRQKPELAAWIESNCVSITVDGAANATLWDCAPDS